MKILNVLMPDKVPPYPDGSTWPADIVRVEGLDNDGTYKVWIFTVDTFTTRLFDNDVRDKKELTVTRKVT